MDLTVEFVDATRPEPPAGWDAFVASAAVHPVWHWPVVHATAGRRRGAALAAMLRDGPAVTGLVYARLAGPARTLADVSCPGSSSMPGLVLPGGLPSVLDPAGVGGPGRALLAAAVAAFEAAVRRERRRVRAVAYRSVFAGELPTVAGRFSLVGRGLPVTMFYNEYPSYERYLAGLSGSRRASQRRQVRLVEREPGLDSSFGPLAGGVDVARFNALADATSRRHETRRWPRARRLSHPQRAALARVPGVLAARYARTGGELVGLGINFDHPSVPLAGPWGALDPHEGGPRGLWFDQHARILRWAIESGRAGVIGGKGLVELKCELGYEQVPQWLVLRRLP
ncbi:hypothetical protein AB0M46_31320 [Dactylosporangium sp. NPDC051485]|uniref:hypothetical protein n=1 Tax=Dactylosporangium sp. NPDC051485 TaxID=3154846 RepID=UPI003413A913